MSVQLIVYPQNYEGQYSTYSTPFYTEYVANYTFLSQTLTNVSKGTSQPWIEYQNTVQAINTWKGWYSDSSVYNVPPVPDISNGRLRLDSYSGGLGSWCGVQQLVTGLTQGAQYDITFDTAAASTGTLYFGNGSSSWTFAGTQFNALVVLQSYLNLAAGTHTITVTAPSTQAVLDIMYNNDDGTHIDLNFVSIKESVGSAPTVDTHADGQVILDLYEESNIPLSLSVDNFKNVAEKSQSYSKAFKLPSTKRNNKIFSSLFDVTRSVKSDVYAFNPYKKTKSILKEDGYTIFDGYLRLIDITEKEDEVSYNVNLYGDTITLSDTLKDKKFKDIDFSELEHTYDKDNIKLSTYDNNGVVLDTALTTSSFAYTAALGTGKTDVIKYPFVKWNGSTYLDGGNVVLQNLEDAFRPFINCKYLVDRIITEAGFTYNSDFLESTDFTKLFMDFNWGEGITPASYSDTIKVGTTYTPSDGYRNINYTTNQIPPHYDISTKKFTADQDNLTFSGSFSLVLLHTGGANEVVRMRWIHKDSAGTEINSSTSYHTIVDSGGVYPEWKHKSFNVTLNDTDTLELQTWLASSASNIDILKDYTNVPYGIYYVSRCSVQTSSIVSMLEALNIKRGDLGQWEFLKGLLTMFNLMVLQDKDNPANLIIEPYKAVFIDDSLSQYITHNTHDWTSKVDVSEMKLKPLPLKKRVLFDFVKEDKDYATGVYKNTTGYKYGSKEIDASSFNLLEGETKVEAKPFGATFIKPIFDNFTTEMTIPVIYTGKDDGTFEGFENKPRILYNNGRVTMANNTYYIPSQNGLTSENQSSFLQFSHLSEIPTTSNTKDYNFNTGQLIGSIGTTPVDNLFNEYWSHYYDELYDADTRTVTLKVYLNPSDISNFEFYDKIRIKNREYRVNKIDYKPYELSTVEFILI
jgi:hypothetical protein